MAKYQKIDEPVFITRIDERGSMHGGHIYEVHFKGIQTQTDFMTYIDPGMINWRKWEHIINTGKRKGVVLSNLKLKDVGLINADSDVRINYVVTKEELAECLADFWNSQSQFGKLFG